MSIRVTQGESRILAPQEQPETRVTQVEERVTATSLFPRFRATQAYLNFVGIQRNRPYDPEDPYNPDPEGPGGQEPGQPGPPQDPIYGAPSTSDNIYVTQAELRILMTFTPNFEWIEMFINEEFPHDISFNSIGATRYQTDVVMVDSGHDQRNSRWDQPLMEYDVAYGVRTMEHLHDLIAFFRVMQGKKHAFLYHDHIDYTSTLAQREEARSIPDTTPLDQIIGVGDDFTKTFQLVKRYPTLSGEHYATRPIYKPKPGTVKIAIDGQEVSWWTCDYNTGKITFTPRHAVTNLQNASIIRQGGSTSTRWRITADGTDLFAGFHVGERIVMINWLNAENNTSESLRVPILDITPSYMDINLPAPHGMNETNRNGVSIYSHPAPDQGAEITAGYHFWVPVRFDTDRLPVSLEEYGIGGAADVKLVEVRPGEQ